MQSDKLIEKFKEIHNDKLDEIITKGQTSYSLRCGRGFMKHDSWFNSVPMIEDYLGDFVHPPEGVESTNPIDLLLPGMVVKGELDSFTSSGVYMNIIDIIYTSTVCSYQHILSKELDSRHNHNSIEYNQPKQVIYRRKSFGGNISLPSTTDYMNLRIGFKNLTSKITGFCARNEWGDVKDYQLYDKVILSGLITEVRDKELILSFSSHYLPPEKNIVLGIIPTESKKPITSFTHCIKESPSFQNPFSLGRTLRLYQINPHDNMISTSQDNLPSYQKLRALQSENYLRKAIGSGKDYLTSGRYAEAISCFDEALNMNNTLIDVMIMKGEALGKMKNYNLAIKQLEKALYYDPGNDMAKKQLKNIEDNIEFDRRQAMNERKQYSQHRIPTINISGIRNENKQYSDGIILPLAIPPTNPVKKSSTVDEVYKLLKQDRAKEKKKKKESRKKDKYSKDHSPKKESKSKRRKPYDESKSKNEPPHKKTRY